MWPLAVRWPPVPGSNPAQRVRRCAAGRSARNYPHLVAERLGYDLVDVTYSGATTANVLRERQHGAPPQVDALDGSEHLVTVTIGGNDVGYVPLLFAATRATAAARAAGDRQRPARPARPGGPRTGAGRRRRIAARSWPDRAHPRAAGPDHVRGLPDSAAAGRHTRPAAFRRRSPTSAATSPTDWPTSPPRPRGTPAARWCGPPQASRDHHAWSADPWTVGAGSLLPWRPKPFHPNAEGMRAVADLVVTVAVSGADHPSTGSC